ncbi:hypothetical protein CEP54_009019 [Fusarium duplospermum]|uniref:Uncharacterized protein n=1 Tax=Fusarium duplospermum TaxID=1325734 RepID=A0A428PSV5_9HYPO|nr:hypothetical protein CEP54_009019 [Fusarium duplospermum]
MPHSHNGHYRRHCSLSLLSFQVKAFIQSLLVCLACTPTLYYPSYTPTNEMDQAEDRIKDESHDTCMLILRVLSLGCLGNPS